jgi:hypothetical protein
LGEAGLGLGPREFVAQFREFDLQLGLPGLGALPEHFEDEREPVEHVHVVGQLSPHVVRLERAHLVVDDDGVGVFRPNEGGELVDLPLAEVVGGVLLSALGEFADDLVAGGAGQVGDLLEIGLAFVDALGDDGAVSRNGCRSPRFRPRSSDPYSSLAGRRHESRGGI